MMLAAERDRADTEAGGIGGPIARILEGSKNARDVIAPDDAIGQVASMKIAPAVTPNRGAARVQQRPAIHDLREAEPRSHGVTIHAGCGARRAWPARGAGHRAFPFSD